ncbi:anion permease, partial [Candidatus Peregrinibacteria bacterium]|nr:anion permease [Candidatus Peregrinibacteria bacterium]
ILKKIQYKFLNKVIHKDFVIKVVLVLFATIVGFVLQRKIGLPNYIIAFMGAMFLGFLTSKRVHIKESLESIEWTTLFFFTGLFIMVAGVEKTGLLKELSQFIAGSTGDLFYLSIIVLWSTGIASMIIDNIPFVTVMVPVILGIQSQLPGVDTTVLWWALSMGACLGGSATIIGASANVVACGCAEQKGVHISFMEYLKFSLPLTLGILVICSVYLFFATT